MTVLRDPNAEHGEKMKPVKNTFKNVEILEVWIDKEKMVVELELS